MMADLTFISETGMFHAACRATFGSAIEWYGFKPRKHRAAVGAGVVDRSNRAAFVNHLITFEVNDTVLLAALRSVAFQYSSKKYVVGVCDCVSFTADVARKVGLKVPTVNLTPYGFIQVLALWNAYAAKY